jgi:GT2 family glycosyltransferase
MTGSLVIPVHLRTPWDLQCLRRLLDSAREQTMPFAHVYIVDDASPLRYSLEGDTVDFIRLPTNGGPAKARNLGAAKALAAGSDHVFFTDHDCILDRDWHSSLSQFLASSSFAAAGGMTYAWGKTLLDRYHELNGTLAGKWLLPDRKELWYMPSLNFGMKSFAVREFPFDERFPSAAGEDVDLCLRLRSKYRIGFCRHAKLWHDFGYSTSVTGLWRFMKLFMKYKSSSATLYEGHTVLMWDASESIFEGNMHESDLQLEEGAAEHRASYSGLPGRNTPLRQSHSEPLASRTHGDTQVGRVVHLPVVQDSPAEVLRCQRQ